MRGDGGRDRVLTDATIWSHSVIPGSCLYADPISPSSYLLKSLCLKVCIRLICVLLDPASDLPWQTLPIALGHLHDLHVRVILDLGDETTAPKSDARHEWDRSFQ